MPEADKSGEKRSGLGRHAPKGPPHSRHSKPRDAHRKVMSGRRRAAVIDLGTNNCRLLIAEDFRGPKRNRSGEFRVIDSFSRIVRLGEGLSQSGVLNSAAMDRTVAALKICARKIKRSGASDVRAVATQACRQASNGREFIERVKVETGISLITIDPMQEVQLGVASTLPLLRKRWSYALIFDVGGGSTEVSFLRFEKGKGFRLNGSISVPLGVVSLAEDFGHRGEDLTSERYDAMRAEVSKLFQSFALEHGIAVLQGKHQVQTVGMSGTVTTVRALDLGLSSYNRKKVDRTLFNMRRAAPIREGLLEGGLAGLSANGCIGKDRADLVLPGMAILEGLGDVFQFQRLLVLDRGLREGLLNEAFASARKDFRGSHSTANSGESI